MKQPDLLDRQMLEDPNEFRKDFPLLDPRNMPKPTMDRLFTNTLLKEEL